MRRALARATIVILASSIVACTGCRTAPRTPDASVSVDRGEAHLAAKDYAGARQDFTAALKANACNARARIGLARTELGSGDPQTALKEVARAERECVVTPDDANMIRLVRGYAGLKLGQPPARVWAQLHPAYQNGDEKTRNALKPELAALARRLPPETPGVHDFIPQPVAVGSYPFHARADWDGRGKSPATIPMGKPYRITIHHSSHDMAKYRFAATSAACTAELIRGMRNYQVDEKHWDDIAYHFVIDPRGDVWEARPLRYQGAHTRSHNEGNIGICVIGNYEVQKPNSAQLKSIKSLVEYLRRKYGIAKGSIFGHEELKATDCPGKNLMTVVRSLRA
jgi:hypothetical protein